MGGIVVGSACGMWYANYWFRSNLEAMPEGESFLVRYDDGKAFISAVSDLVDQGVIRNERAFRLYCRMNDREMQLEIGTYKFHPGMKVKEVLTAMESPISQDVTIPEGWWIARVAPILEKNNVCTADEYIALANDPSFFDGSVGFPLPEDSLEGYLYPDKYDFPPLYGAENVIRTMLATFETKVWQEMEGQIPIFDDSSLGGSPQQWQVQHYVTMASLVELEAGVEKDRPLIAGVIKNRLEANMPLALDATILYALQEWRTLKAGETQEVKSPYNTYRNAGLPPGPIGSPAWRSINAAINPAEHKFYYFYAPPGSDEHIFTKNYNEHRRAIRNPERYMPPPIEENSAP